MRRKYREIGDRVKIKEDLSNCLGVTPGMMELAGKYATIREYDGIGGYFLDIDDASWWDCLYDWSHEMLEMD